MSLPPHSIVDQGPDRGSSLLDRPVLPLVTWDWEKAAFIAIVLLAGLLRLWDLGSRALHHDESLHALYSWYLYVGRGYLHDPLMHGPFQFHATALTYFLFGVSDYTARILPALLGTVAVALPYFLRDRLGHLGALFTAGLLALSPSMLYYSRFLRNDIFIVVWNLLLIIALWRFIQTGRRAYLLLGAAALGLGFSSKEVTYLTVMIFGSYLLLTTLREVLPRVVSRFDLHGVSPRAGFMVMLGTLALPQGAATATILWSRTGFDPAQLAASPPGQLLTTLLTWWNGLFGGGTALADPSSVGKLVAAMPVVALLLGISAFIGWRWDWKLWLAAAGVFYAIFFVLFTTFFTNLSGSGSGIWGGLEYWLNQQGVQRGGQPWYYYLVVLPIYEFLPVVLAAVGVIYFGLRHRFRDEFSRFLAWWIVASFMLYGFAGEKMPWLSLHIALPIILLAGKTLGELLPKVSWSQLRASGGIFLALLAPLVPLALRALINTGDPFESGPDQALRLLQTLAAAGALAFLLGTAWQFVKRLGAGATGQTLALVALALLGAFTVRAAVQLSYAHGDIPVEMLVYTQTSPEVPRIMDNIELIAAETGQDQELPITVDAAQGFTWPWAWYLRDYKNVGYPDLGQTPGEPTGAVLLLNANNQAANEPLLTKYEPGQRFRHRWWFPEDYRNLTVSGLLSSLVNPAEWSTWWAYFYNRELGIALGSSDALVYYPQGFRSAGGLLTEHPSAITPPQTPPEPLPDPILVESDQVLAGRAPSSGGLISPKGLALDGEGNIYVVDSRAARVTKLDPSGRVLARVGRPGKGDGEFTEPWGIAVDSGGNVYVADTWNHRIQKFDSNLRFQAKWGTFGSVAARGGLRPGAFWGPRGMAIDSADSLYVTDTGNKRVQKFSPDGEVLDIFDGTGRDKGRFQEPVGIAISPSGEILVADTWNRRVQRFDENFKYVGEFPVAGWVGQGVMNKPYLAVGPQGNVLVTDPQSHRMLRYSSTGVLLNVYGRFGSDRSSFNIPAAVAIDAQGRVYVSDSDNSRVVRLPPLD